MLVHTAFFFPHRVLRADCACFYVIFLSQVFRSFSGILFLYSYIPFSKTIISTWSSSSPVQQNLSQRAETWPQWNEWEFCHRQRKGHEYITFHTLSENPLWQRGRTKEQRTVRSQGFIPILKRQQRSQQLKILKLP